MEDEGTDMINSKCFMKGRVLDSSASFVVTLQASGKSFSVQPDETILDASLNSFSSNKALPLSK